MKYKVGDKVKLKSKEGLDELKRQVGDLYIHPDAYKNAGSEQTILECSEGFYCYDASAMFWHESLFEGLVEEGTKVGTALNPIEPKSNANYLTQERVDELETKPKDMGEVSDGYHTFNELYEFRLLYNAALFNEFAKQGLYDVHKSRKHSDGEYPFGDSNWFIVMAELPTGQISNHYEMKDWGKFQIPEKPLANKWDEHSPKDVAERLSSFTTPKKEYPKTYDECCKVLNIAVRDLDILDNMLDTTEIIYSKNLDRLLNSFRKLIICRDAYLKIAGDEMGLGKSWEPDYDSGVDKFGIICLGGVVQESNPTTNWERHLNKILDFPTREMRDAFKENFDPNIEFCKEFL